MPAREILPVQSVLQDIKQLKTDVYEIGEHVIYHLTYAGVLEALRKDENLEENIKNAELIHSDLIPAKYEGMIITKCYIGHPVTIPIILSSVLHFTYTNHFSLYD